MSSPPTPSVTRSSEDENPFTFTTEIIILLGLALGLSFTLIICCCWIAKKRKEKRIEATRRAIEEGRVSLNQLLDAEKGRVTFNQLLDAEKGRVTFNQLLDAGMSPQSVVEAGAGPSQLFDEGPARPHEVGLRSQAGVPVVPIYPGGSVPLYPHCEPHPVRLDQLLRTGFIQSQRNIPNQQNIPNQTNQLSEPSTHSVVHRNKERKAGRRTVVGSDGTLKEASSNRPERVVVVRSDETLNEASSNGPKRVVVEPSEGTIYTGSIKRVVRDGTEIYDSKRETGKKIDATNTFSTWMSPTAGKKNVSKEPSTDLSSYKQLGKNKSPGRVVVVESNVSRKGSMATDVNEFKEPKMMPQNNVSKVKTVPPSMKTQRRSRGEKMVSKIISKKVVTKSMSPRTNKKGSSKYDVED